jgi:hypothetical protein
MSQSALVAELTRLYQGSEAGGDAPDSPRRFRKLLSWPRNA